MNILFLGYKYSCTCCDVIRGEERLDEHDAGDAEGSSWKGGVGVGVGATRCHGAGIMRREEPVDGVEVLTELGAEGVEVDDDYDGGRLGIRIDGRGCAWRGLEDARAQAGEASMVRWRQNNEKKGNV